MVVAGVNGSAGGAAERATAPETPNRARWARVSASGFRLARFDEVPKVRGLMANVPLSLPQIRPRWVPRYALDGSRLTGWAAEEAEGGQKGRWLQLELGNGLCPRVTVSAVRIIWGNEFASRYQIMGTGDGHYWKPVHQQDNGPGGEELIPFNPPIMVSSLRLEILGSKWKSTSVLEFEVYGSGAEVEPAAVPAPAVEPLGPDRLRLKWEQARDEVTYFYRVYRAEGQEPPLDSAHLVATTWSHGLDDYGRRPDRVYFYRVVAESFGGKTRPTAAAVSAKTASGPEFYRFPLRGVVEGFYNDPWPHQERLRMLGFMAAVGLNAYIYAPKVEPFHRQRWREPYPETELANFAELAATARAHGITFIYGISPGLDMNIEDPAEVRRLEEKLDSLYRVGVRAFIICLDDIPGAGGANRALASRQARLVNEVFEFLRARDPANQLFMAPTVYSHTYSYWQKKKKRSAEYLAGLAAVNPAVGIFWTGPGEVFSASIDQTAAAPLAAVWGRPVLIWDNYPVNDAGLRNNLFTGPYLGRSPDLAPAVGGIFLNPMYLPHASKIALYTAAKYMTRESYDPWATYEEGLKFLGGGEEGGFRALKAISDCLIPHPIYSELSLDQMPVSRLMEAFWTARKSGQGREAAAAALRDLFTVYANNPTDLREHLADEGLADDLLPASQKLSLYGRAGLKCMEFMAEPAADRRMVLRNEILQLQGQARVILWRVADERTTFAYIIISPAFLGRRVVFDDFITRALSEVPL